MRIAFILDRYPCLSETFIAAQIAGLRRRGYAVDVYADETGPAAAHAIAHGLPPLQVFAPVRIAAGLRAGRWLAAGRSLQRCARSWARAMLKPQTRLFGPAVLLTAGRYAAALPGAVPRYDVVHAHFGPNGIKAAAMRAAGVVHGPLVVSFHGYDLSSFIRRSASNVYSPLFREASLCLPVTERWARRLVELGCPERIIRVHRMGVDTSSFVPAPRERSGGPVRIITVARLVEKKGIADGIRAVAALVPALDVRYTIVGTGPEEDRLRALIDSLGVSDRISLAGALPHAAIADQLRAADIAMLPSRTATDGDEEGLPVSLMEAMAAGIPVVATRHSGIPELVDDGVEGFLTAEQDVPALAGALSALVEAPALRERMGRAARTRVVKQHDQQLLDDELVAMYQMVAGTSRPRTAHPYGVLAGSTVASGGPAEAGAAE